MPPIRLVIGCGYVGERVAQRWREAGDNVFVTTRSVTRAESFQQQGFVPLVVDVTQPTTLAGLPKVDTVLLAVGHDARQSPDITRVYVDGMRHVLATLPVPRGGLIYVSSTGVYGPAEGDWVDETTPCLPSRPGGRAALVAEELLLASHAAPATTILRLAGIYGPGRLPRQSELLEGRPLAVPDAGWLNLIHVEDAVAAVLLVAQHTSRGERFNVADGCPVQRGDYLRELARLIGAPVPTFTPPAADSPRAMRALDDKRVDTQRLREVYGFRPRYASYREGLLASLAAKA